MTSLRALLLTGLLALRAGAGEIHTAAIRGDVAAIKALAAKDPALLASTDAEGFTPLHLAVIQRQPEAVAALIAAGARVDARDRDGATPLQHLAHSVEESVLENFKRASTGRFGEALARLTEGGRLVTPSVLLGLLRADLADVDEPLTLMRNFAAASTAAQMDAELRCTRALLAAGADAKAIARDRSTPLHHAAMSPQPDLAQALLEAGADVNAQDSSGLTPLHNAALFGSTETTAFLLEKGAAPDGRSVLVGVPPLLMAVTRGDPRTITLLLDHRADVNALGPDGETALARAAALGATEAAFVLLHHGARVGARVGRANRTPLHIAAAHGFVPMIALLLESSAEIEAKDSAGFTPLLDAAEQGRTAAIRELLLKGAKVNATNSARRTAVWLAASRGHVESVGYLLNHGADATIAAADGQTPVHVAAYNARPAALQLLLERKPALNTLSRLGTPLHSAAAGPTMRAIFAAQAKPGQKIGAAGTVAESAGCARMLVEAGAPLAAQDENGNTAVQVAAAFGNKAVLVMLIGKDKSKATARDANGMTALHHAARGPLLPGFAPDAQPALTREALAGTEETVTWLLAAGDGLNGKDQAGLTPLHHAASAGNLPALKALLAAKPDLRIPDKAGATALHWAAARGRAEAISALLAAKAPVAAIDADGQTPLHMAVAAGHVDAARLLLDGGADPNFANRRGQNALSYAEAYNRPEIAKLLRDRGARAAFPP